jgi:hypothetical protein
MFVASVYERLGKTSQRTSECCNTQFKPRKAQNIQTRCWGHPTCSSPASPFTPTLCLSVKPHRRRFWVKSSPCETRWLLLGLGERKWARRRPGAADEYGWGPEDDAPLPPDSQMATGVSFVSHTYLSQFPAVDSDTDAAGDAHDSETDAAADAHEAVAEYDDVPGLSDVSDSENAQSDTKSLMPDLEDGNSDSDDDTPPAPAACSHPAPPSAPPRPVTPTPMAKTNRKISVYFQPETVEERTIRWERDAREHAERAEMVRLREVEETRKKHARERADANERMRQHRARAREVKISNGWVPGQKRVSPADASHTLTDTSAL